MIAIANHQPPAMLIHLANVGVDVGGHLGPQRRGQHLPGPITDDLIQQRTARRTTVLVGRLGVVDYLEHRRAFPNRRSNAGPDQNYMDFRSSSGRCAPSRHLAEDHPQVLIIARNWGRRMSEGVR